MPIRTAVSSARAVCVGAAGFCAFAVAVAASGGSGRPFLHVHGHPDRLGRIRDVVVDDDVGLVRPKVGRQVHRDAGAVLLERDPRRRAPGPPVERAATAVDDHNSLGVRHFVRPHVAELEARWGHVQYRRTGRELATDDVWPQGHRHVARSREAFLGELTPGLRQHAVDVVVEVGELDEAAVVEIVDAVAEALDHRRREHAGVVAGIGVRRQLGGPHAAHDETAGTGQRWGDGRHAAGPSLDGAKAVLWSFAPGGSSWKEAVEGNNWAPPTHRHRRHPTPDGRDGVAAGS
jgi:hypothetical protein